MSNHGLMSGIAALGQLQEVQNIWFNKKTVALDGYRFIGCRFDSCTIFVNSANFELIGCHIDLATIISYSGDALKIIKLFNSRNEGAYSHYPSFAPERNEDGTITIKGVR